MSSFSGPTQGELFGEWDGRVTMAKIISASRRTDIPRFFGKWFVERRKAGFAQFRNAFGGQGTASLRNEDVIGYLFWTKFAGPFHDNLDDLRDQGIPYVFQYTMTGYGAELEPKIPKLSAVIDDFLAVSKNLPSLRSIQWRYDPIVVSGTMGFDVHLKQFENIASALEGATDVVNISFVEPYLKAIRRIDDDTVKYRELDPERHKAASKKYPDLPQISDDEIRPFLLDLAAVAHKYGMELRSCANPEWDLPKAQCCGAEMFIAYGKAITERIAKLAKGPSRPACQCLQSVDIGMDNTCVGGCKYCYVVTSHETALTNFKNHDPKASMLR